MTNERNYDYKKVKANQNLPRHHTLLLRVTAETVEALSKYEEKPSRLNQAKFKTKLNRLVKLYWAKFSQTDEVEMPDFILRKNVPGPVNTTKIGVKKCKQIFYKIQELQEELEHTKIESMDRGDRMI